MALTIIITVSALICLGLTLLVLFGIVKANGRWRDEEDEEQMEYLREHFSKGNSVK